MNNQLDMMVKALGGGSQSPDQSMNPMGMGGNSAQGAMGAAGGMGGGGMLGGMSMGLLPMLLQGGGPMSLMKLFQNKKDTDGNPAAAADTPGPGTFTPGGQPNPSSPSVTPF